MYDRLWRSLALGLALLCGAVARPAAAATDVQVEQAVADLVTYLYAQQSPEGHWEPDDLAGHKAEQETGISSLVTYALLSAGESYQDPRMRKALNWLRENPGRGTYAVSIRAHIWALLPDEFRPNLEQEARWLLGAHNDSSVFLYQQAPNNRNAVDHSTTQYGILGLWEFSKRGGRVDPRFWTAIVEHLNKTQSPDGGWSYSPRGDEKASESRGSMTAAGLTMLFIAQQELLRERKTPEPTITQDIAEGLAWFDKHFSPTKNFNGPDYHYYAYCVERVALASGLDRFGGVDWFSAMSDHLISQIKAVPSATLKEIRDKNPGVPKDAQFKSVGRGDVIDTSFALAFLARGRVPVWINKLQIPGTNWNNRPNDIYFLTRYLSDEREAELNWQVVSVDSKPEDWLRAPVMFLSSDSAVKLTAPQQANLKRYLDLGGLLIANGEGSGFDASITSLAKTMYPDYKFETLARKDPLTNLVRDVSGGRDSYQPKLKVLRNGVRDLIVLPDTDWGYEFQAKKPDDSEAWNYITNIYASATDRGRLTNRLVEPLPLPKAGVKSTGNIDVVRGEYDGNWNAEPLALEVAAVEVLNTAGRQVKIRTAKLSDLGTLKPVPDLVHVTGTESTVLAAAAVAGLTAYVKAGGTVLVESLGGRSSFADEVGAQLAEALAAPRRWLDSFSPVLDGTGIKGAVDATKVRYRMYSVIIGSPQDRPSLAALYVDDRAAVIISPRDLSLGALGSRAYEINGYRPESARNLLHNILLHSAQK